jgi:hypothetical protein
MTEPRYPSKTSNFRISNSSLQQLLRCGLAFQFAREDRHRSATPKMVIGTSVAAAAEHDNRAKIAQAPRPSLADLVDVGVARFEREVSEVDVPASRLELDQAKDSAAEGSRAYGELLSPGIEDVLFAEEVVIAEISPGLELAGTVDMIQQAVVRDVKTGRKWSKQRADATRQLSAYALLYEARLGEPPARVAIDSLYEERGRWRAETLWSRRSERELSAFIETAERAKAAIEAGTFLPAPDGSWYCSHDWCPFWRNNRCTARSGA